MNKDMEKVAETVEKGTNAVVNTFVDRVVDRVDQIEPTVEKGKKTFEKMAQITVDGISTVIDAAADHFAGVINKELNLETERERIKNTMETLVEKTGEYIEVVADSVSGGIAQAERIIEKDIEAAEEVNKELIGNYHNLKKD